MAKKKVRWKSLVGFVGIIAILSTILAVVLVQWKHPAIISTMEAVISQGITGEAVCEIGEGSVSFFGGVEAREVKIYAPADGGGVVEVEAASMKVRPRMGEVLGDLKRVRRVLKKPALLREDQHELDTVVMNWVKTATLKNARIEYRGGVYGPITLSNARIRLQPGNGSDSNIEIAIRADSLRAQTVLSEDIVVQVRRSWPHLEFEVQGKAYRGSFQARFAGDFEKFHRSGGSIEVKEVDVGELHADLGGKNRVVRGVLDANIELDPGNWDLSRWSGDGKFRLRNACFEELTILNSVVALIAVPQLRRLEFEEIGGKFRIEDGTMVSEKISGRGKPIAVTASGRIGIDGNLDCSIEGCFQKSYEDSLDAFVWGAMNPGKDDSRTFRCRLSGPHDRVRVGLDRSHRKRAMRTILNSLQKEFGSFFRR